MAFSWGRGQHSDLPKECQSPQSPPAFLSLTAIKKDPRELGGTGGQRNFLESPRVQHKQKGPPILRSLKWYVSSTKSCKAE